MRIFKDKVDSNKGLVNTLAQDVARSKIILVVTDLTGDSSGIPIISKAIGLPLVSPDKAEYGIKTAEAIYMPENAVPLVTKSGIYGGCIIECGPQSIIIVSSVRSLRHEIMKAYVHNYVFDVAQLLAYQERMGQNGHSAMPPMVRKPAAGLSSADTGDSGPADSVADDEPASSPVSSYPEYDTDTEDPEPTGLILEISPTPGSVSEVAEQEDQPHKRPKRKSRTANILLLIIVILLLIGFGILAYFFVYLPLIGETGTFSNGSDNFFTDILNNFLE